MLTRDPSNPVAMSPPRDPGTVHDAFIESLGTAQRSPWPHRLLMEIECVNDPDELEAAMRIGMERVAWLRRKV